MAEVRDQEQEEDCVVSMTNPKTGQTITLIGTAHLSERSNDQVQRLIEALQPNAVMIEIDPSRLERLGLADQSKINIEVIVNSEDIELPLAQQQKKPINGLVGLAQKAFVGVFSQIARASLTQMYKSLETNVNSKAGGEFLRAIQSAEKCTACDTLILGDRNSMTTIQRVAELAIESGDFWGVFGKLEGINKEEMDLLEPKVRKELLQQKGQENNDEYELDEGELTMAMMEKLKEDDQFRTRLFANLEQSVPEFTQAFLKERDYLMSESIRWELDSRPNEIKTVVGVVGLGHIPGMEKHFEAIFAGRPAPLAQEPSDAAAAATNN